MLTINLTEEEMHMLLHRLSGDPKSWGGFQRLLARLQQEVRVLPGQGAFVSMSEQDAGKVLMYSAAKYGNGTYQKILRLVVPKVKAALDAAPEGRQIELLFEER